jgi:hypothetical protein
MAMYEVVSSDGTKATVAADGLAVGRGGQLELYCANRGLVAVMAGGSWLRVTKVELQPGHGWATG